jgi:phosphatidylserine/phosphatidylglycerophosphate/cardiolipin synthase-like enzyme
VALAPALLALALLAAPPARQVRVYFSPDGGALEAVIAEIDGAKHWVRLQGYSFTSRPIAAALARAAARGVDVSVCLDKGQPTARGSRIPDLLAAGIPVRIDRAHAIAHSKTMVLDGETTITGSYNWTDSAEHRNLENLWVIPGRGPAAAVGANWSEHAAHSIPVPAR